MNLKKAGSVWEKPIGLDKMKQYLTCCISNLDLHQIVVSKSDRNRAIDIYEKLKYRWHIVSTFELVLAKAAKRSLQVIRIFLI